MFKKTILLIILFLPILSTAEEKGPEFEIPCSNAPDGAVTEVPKPISDIASIKCTIYGHILTGADGVLWNYPGGFSPVIIPSQMVRSEPEKVNHKFHFTSVTAKQLSKEEAIVVYKHFGKGFDEMPKDAPETIEIIAINQKSVSQKVYLFQLAPETIWGYACQPICKPEMSFMVMKFERPKS
jgi:hypothetical protein